MASIMRYIDLISRCGAIYRSDRLGGTELGSCHFPYILTLCREPGISQEGLARRIYIGKSSVTRALAYLESHGYVRREPDAADRRVMRVYPTAKAEEALPLIRGILRGWNEYLTEGLRPDEKETLTLLLEKAAACAAEYADFSVLSGEGDEK